MAAQAQMEMLLALVRMRWTAQRPELRLPNEEEWPALLAAAERHRVVPLLDEALRSSASPEHHLCEIHTRRLAIAARAMFLLNQATRLAARCAGENIRLIAWRGPILAHVAYGDATLRASDDIDCLVAPADIPRVMALMRAEQFAWPLALDERTEQYYRRAVGEYIFWPPGREFQVEINTGLGVRYHGWKIEFERLWETRQMVTIRGQPVATLSNEDLLPLACVHAGKHLWQRLQWVCDIAAVLQGGAILDWDHVWRLAAGLKSQRMVATGLRLAHELLGAELPGDQLTRAALLAQPVYDVSRDLMLGRDDRHKSAWRAFRYHWTMYDTLQTRLKFAAGMVFEPSVGDWRWVRLPACLYCLYYLLRPIRLGINVLCHRQNPRII